jgi:hypothetical protein
LKQERHHWNDYKKKIVVIILFKMHNFDI